MKLEKQSIVMFLAIFAGMLLAYFFDTRYWLFGLASFVLIVTALIVDDGRGVK